MRKLKILFLAFSLLLSGVEVVFGQTGCDFLIALDNDLKGPNGHQLDHFFKTNPKGVRAWEVARQFTDHADISLLTRLANDLEDRPILATIIKNHVDPEGAFNTWNRVSLGERFIAEAKFYNVMDELVPPGVDYNFTWVDPSTGESFIWGAPTSGLKIYSNAPKGTFIIGGFGPDLKFLLPQFPTATIGHPTVLSLPDHINQLNDWISAGFPQPIGSQFNLLNVYDPLFAHVLNNPNKLVTYEVFTDRGAGTFFTFINGPWMDAAVQQNQFILVASNVSEYVYETPTKLTGFGKEIHRLEWIHGYRFNPSNNKMVPPSEAAGLSALTREGDLDHGF